MLGELALKARMTTDTLNTVEGVRCNEVMGAMYAFPRIFLPDKAIAAAKVVLSDRCCRAVEIFPCVRHKV